MSQYDLAIVGGGPAGLAAAVMAQKSNLKFALITPDLGGKVNYGFTLRDRVQNGAVWGAEMVHDFAEQIERLPASGMPNPHIKKPLSEIVREEDGSFRLTLQAEQGIEHTIRSRAVLICTGATQQRLYVPGEKEYWGRGLSYSAISHARFFAGKAVAIVGYGQRMMVAALQLADIASKLYVLPTITLDPADLRTVRLQKHANVEIIEGWHVQEVVGDEFVTGLMLVKGYEKRTLPVEGVFIQLGLIPNTDFVRNLVTLDEETGCIPVNQFCESSTPGLFAAGDVTTIFSEQVPVAIGEGIKAAISAWEYLVTDHSKSLPAEKWVDLSF